MLHELTSVLSVKSITFRDVTHQTTRYHTPKDDHLSQFYVENQLGEICRQKKNKDRICGLVVRVPGYRSWGPGSIPGTTRKRNVVGLERGPLSLVSTTEELLDRKVAAPV
jgi:hypothetical protein